MKDGLWIVAGIFLGYSAYRDLRCGMISVRSCLLAAGLGIGIKGIRMLGGYLGCETSIQGTVSETASWMEYVTGLLSGIIPGMIVMGLAIGSGEEIGKGDAWIMLALGVLVGAGRCVSLFVAALIVFFPFTVIWHRLCGHGGICGKPESCGKPPKQRLPFVPSLFLAYVLLTLFS